jgi:hypothetical protein
MVAGLGMMIHKTARRKLRRREAGKGFAKEYYELGKNMLEKWEKRAEVGIGTYKKPED